MESSTVRSKRQGLPSSVGQILSQISCVEAFERTESSTLSEHPVSAVSRRKDPSLISKVFYMQQYFPLFLSSPAKPAERFGYARVAQLEAGPNDRIVVPGQRPKHCSVCVH